MVSKAQNVDPNGMYIIHGKYHRITTNIISKGEAPHRLNNYLDVSICTKVPQKIHTTFHKQLESFGINMQYVAKEHEEFIKCEMEPTNFDQCNGCGNETSEAIKMKATIQTLRA